ncbi:MAG TPA: FISUMP domain-containing protein, partial [Bacteroidales bacterium]|nr:FISUMP domain-containing protein [Bacteroidales bacterium]
MKKFALSFLCLIPFVLQAQNSAPVISNLSVSERVDNSFLVDIYYDLHDADGDAMTVTLKVSNDNGATWNYLIDPGHLSGDFGQGIMSGIGKHIIWDFGAGNTGGFFLQLKFKLTADDGFTPVMGMPCPGLATLAYGGQIYNTVQIGAQCWMRENLNVGVMVNSYGAYYQSGMHNDSVIEKYCYGNISSNCNIYGALYEWNEAMGYTEIELAQGICPTGWHIPSEGEWRTLEGYIDSQYDENSNEWDNWEDRGYDAGGRMKETGSTYWQSPNTGATNEFGFAALPGGHREPWNGEFYSAGSVAYYWSSTPRPWGYAYSRELTHNNKRIARRYNHQYRIQGYSVRCIKTQCNPIPDQANAGPDASLLSGTTHQLQANQPINGSGQWSILSGQGGSIS